METETPSVAPAAEDQCLVCGNPIEQPPTGRKRKTCSDACRQAAHKAARAGEHAAGAKRSGNPTADMTGTDLAEALTAGVGYLNMLAGRVANEAKETEPGRVRGRVAEAEAKTTAAVAEAQALRVALEAA